MGWHAAEDVAGDHQGQHVSGLSYIRGNFCYFFKSFLLGLELVWQALHGLPWPIAGVASAFGAPSSIAKNVSKTAAADPEGHHDQ